jgi:hypothetical protein
MPVLITRTDSLSYERRRIGLSTGPSNMIPDQPIVSGDRQLKLQNCLSEVQQRGASRPRLQ